MRELPEPHCVGFFYIVIIKCHLTLKTAVHTAMGVLPQ